MVLHEIHQAAREIWQRASPAVREAARRLRGHVAEPTGLASIGLVLLIGAWILWSRCGVAGCPSIDGIAAFQPAEASVLLDRHGVAFAQLSPVEYEVVAIDSLPDWVGQAFIAVEDRRFFEHDGVDWVRVLGALWANIRASALVEGSSTITMQVARTLLADRIPREEKTFGRKLTEARVAGRIERRFTKHEILELYVNHVYLGGGTHGVESASRYYFGKPARDLTLAEAALLAALPKAPTHYDPWRNPDAALSRRNLVLSLMEEQGYITEARADSALESGLRVVAQPDGGSLDRLHAPWFVRQVRRLLEQEFDDIYATPLRITTTLDLGVQAAAEAQLAARLADVESGTFGTLRAPEYDRSADPDSAGTDYLQGAVVFMDARGGDILAWVGGRDFGDSRFDRAMNGRRQIGSAFKPFVFAAALEAGFAPSQPIMDEPISFTTGDGRTWEPRNYSGLFEGPMTMRQVLVRSQNVPAVRLAAAVGDEKIADLAHRAGIEGEVPASPVAALGVTAVSPLEITEAYSAFAGLGTRVVPRFVLRVEDASGQVLSESRPERVQVMDTAVAFVVSDMLRDVLDHGTGGRVRRAFRGPAAGKTGTTSDVTDVWFVGYTPDLVGTVWIGFDDRRSLPSRATGGGVAAPVWGRIAARAYRDRPESDWWDTPAGLVALRIDPESGFVLEKDCRPRWDDARFELFRRGEVPRAICPRRTRSGVFGQIAGWVDRVFLSGNDPSWMSNADPDLGMPRVVPGNERATIR